MPSGEGNIPPGPILKGGKIKRKTRKQRKIPLEAKGVQWPSGSIVYLCGKSNVPFGPKDDDLGGSEQAVVQLSKFWASKGYTVVVYGSVKECMSDGVQYRSINTLNLADTFDTVIFWRSMGIRLFPLIQAKRKFVDLHDSWDPKNYINPNELVNGTTRFFVKSDYHRSLYPYIPDSKITVLMNGVQIDLFEKECKSVHTREPHRLIYASSYERGLLPLLQYTWPKIKKEIPDAEFHIFYGLNRLEKTPLGKQLKQLFKQPGVFEHGRVSLEEIAKQKCMSAIHLYVSNSETEIDCISVRESLICGSVPVLGNDYVFKERDGIHVSGSTDAKSTYQKAAITTLRFLKDQDALEKKRNELRQSDTLISWEKVGQKWLDLLR